MGLFKLPFEVLKKITFKHICDLLILFPVPLGFLDLLVLITVFFKVLVFLKTGLLIIIFHLP
ncbi:MAG: hypothetical protein D6B25_17170 [Desulfobulbaceae bacterium]|nr:MAG: hypothetical protein D6B25_17170 [Desulfobulbaceae bacterium]